MHLEAEVITSTDISALKVSLSTKYMSSRNRPSSFKNITCKLIGFRKQYPYKTKHLFHKKHAKVQCTILNI